MILKSQNSFFGPYRYNNVMLFFILFINLLINKVSSQSTAIKDCACDNEVYNTDLVAKYKNAYCLNSSDKIISSFGLYQDAKTCNEATDAFKTEIEGVNNNEWIFFDDDGNVISASSNTLPKYCYYKDSGAYAQVTTEDGMYYLNKYKGGMKLYEYSSSFTEKTIEANKAYQTSDGTNSLIIFCKSSKNCNIISEIKGYFYINGGDSKSVFYYDTALKKMSVSSDLYFVYEMGDLDGLIDCPASGTCSVKSIAPKSTANTSGKYVSEGYYLGKGYNTNKNTIINAIIQCTIDYGCKVVYNEEDDLQPTSTEAYFINAAPSKTTNPLIKYDSTPLPSYTEVPADAANIYYINDGSESNKPLIYCKTTTSCEAVEADESYHYISYSKNLILYDTDGWNYLDADQSTGYLLNGGVDRYDKPLIYCSDADNCSTVSAKTDGYYIYNNLNALIYCSTEHSCVILENPEEGYYINNQTDQTSNPIIQCSDNDCNPYKLEGPGYFLDQSTFSNNKYYGLIYCSSATSCSQVDFLPGYYSNSNIDSEIIECQTSCSSKTATTCSGSDKTTIYAGSYCYEDSILNFVYKTIHYNETKTELDENEVKEYLINVSSEESSLANYAYTAVNADVFPGITSSLSTLFKISKSSITQVIEDGMIAINTKTNARMTSYTDGISLGSKLSLYKCQSSSRKCTPMNTCSSEMYIYDSGTQKGLYCNGSNLSSISTAGYYVDGSRTVNGKTPYVLDCNAVGICQSLSPSNVYMINSGFDKITNRLIYCSADSCSTVVANIGYYLSYDQKGVIQCTSSTKCSYQPVNTFRYYINAGAVNSSKIVIQCHSGKCSLINPNPGYYITHTPYVLINCTSRSQCTEVNVSEGHYSSAYKGTATTSYIIHCINLNGNISCGLESTNIGAYVSNNSNILVICDENECKTIEADIGTYISASSSGSSKIKRNEEGMDIVVPEHNLQKRSSGHGIISCDSEICKELSPAELALIPTCTFSNNKCFISYDYSLTASAVTSVSAGGYCTNADRSKLYFATDSIVVESTVIGSTSSTYLYTTTNTNCIEVSKNYKSFYYTVGSVIYHLDDNRITQVVKNGYYFINVIENTLATGKDIDEYNNSNTKIYKCNGSYCSTIETLKTDSYFADVNKKIIKYTAETQKYSFPYTKDIICIYEDNTCTPKYDMEKRDFCITYLGELALTTTNILSRETAPCYKSKSIDTNIYGFSQNNLYRMNGFSAFLVVNTGYHIVTKSTNYTAEYKDYESKPKKIVIYGCVKKNCNVYTPKDKVYYYDSNNKSMYRMVNGVWETPSKSGFAYISVSPIETFVYKFTIKNHEVIIENKVNSGFYYTVDNEMYECTTTSCKTISDSGYVFTNNGEIYYCEWDSEELEDTVCKIQECVNSQYYYIDGYYYRCDTGNRLSIMTSKNCVYSSNYIINFPTILSDDYPAKIRNAVEKIARNNNSTATTKGGRNYLPVVPAVYTNCTYNFEDKEASFDLVCVKNYVKMNNEEEPEICSVSNMGYIYCSDDSDNPNKCNPSSAFRTLNLSVLHIAMTLIIIFFLARF